MVPSPLKILIIRLSSIGDILLTSPLIRQIRKTYPHARIDFVVKDIFFDLVRFHPEIQHVRVVNTGEGRGNLKELKQSIRQSGYDIILDLHNNFRSNFLRRGLNSGKVYQIKKNKVQQALLVYLKINRYRASLPIAERYLRVAQNIGINDDGKGLEIYWDKKTEKTTADKLTEKINPRTPYICFAPGAAFSTKRWPRESFEALIRRIKSNYSVQCVILGGGNDEVLAEYLAEKTGAINFAGKTSLLESAAILRGSKMLITNDTGLMHMGSAVQIPVLAIFGSTVEEFGFFPYRAKSVVIENKAIRCRPCTHMGKNTCPKTHFKCMKDITVDQVYSAIPKLIDL